MPFRFRNFEVYRIAKELHLELAKTCSSVNFRHNYILDQVLRSSLSIQLNIAEGSSKQSDKDFNRFITISLGSVDETVACLEVMLEMKLINKDRFDYFENNYEILSNKLGSFSKKLKYGK